MRRFVLFLACLVVSGVAAWRLTVPGVGEPMGVVLVRVIDAAGQGIAGARVAGGKTDSSGSFQVGVPAGQEATVPVSREGYCAAEISVGPLPTGGAVERWVRLARGCSLEAKLVTRKAGTPAIGATVRLEAFGAPVDAVALRTATTGSDGLVRFEGVPYCYVELTAIGRYVSKPHRVHLVEGCTPDLLAIEASAATRVVVEIVDRDGAAVRGARVLASTGGAGSPRVAISHDGRYETQVPEGRECVIDVVDTSWARGGVRLVGDGRLERRERVALIAARDHPDAHEVRLRAVDQLTHRPVPGAHVTIEFGSPALPHTLANSDAFEIPDMMTDHEGLLVVSSVPFGEIVACVSHPGFENAERISLVGDAGVIEGTLYMKREDVSRIVTCRAGHPVEIHWLRKKDREDGAVALSGFNPEQSTCDIRYRPKGDIARDLVLESVPIGSTDVTLPVYPMGDMVVRCSDADGLAVTGAEIFVGGDGFAGTAGKQDPRGAMLLRDIPAGKAEVWVRAWGWGEVGPIECVVPDCGRVEVDARFGRRRALLGVRVSLGDGSPAPGFQVLVRDSAGEPVDVVPERFKDSFGGSPVLETLSDGRCYLPVAAQEILVALRGLVRTSWGGWELGGPLFGFERVVVPADGIVGVDFKVDWEVFVSGMHDTDVESQLRRGDVILTWDGKTVRDVDDCRPSEGHVVATVRRGGMVIELKLPPGPHTAIMNRQYFVAR